jgi:uncharacterized protein
MAARVASYRAIVTVETVPERTTYVLVDGENIDAVLGQNILGRRPTSDERPRWDRVLDFAARVWDQPARGLFFLNATSGTLPMGFVQALLAMDYRPVPLAGRDDQKVVDIGIQRTLAAIADRDADVLLLSHDGDFLEDMSRLLDREDRRVGLIGFGEFFNNGFAGLDGVQRFDLEHDVRAFNALLPRVRIIALNDFDPETFL